MTNENAQRQKEGATRETKIMGITAALSKIPKWLWPTSLVAFFILKIAIAAHGDQTSMLVLVSSTTSIVSMALAVFTASLVWVIGAATWFWMTSFMENLREGDPIKVALLAVLSGLTGCLLFLPSPLFIFLLYFFVFTTITNLLMRYGWPIIKKKILRSNKPVKSLRTNRTTQGEAIFAFLFVLPLASFFLLGDRLWLPSEKITDKTGHTTTAYIVSVDDISITVLQPDTRQISHLSNTTIAQRETCSLDGAIPRSVLFSFLWPQTTEYKKC